LDTITKACGRIFEKGVTIVLNETVDETQVTIRQYTDIVAACRKGYALAKHFDLPDHDQVALILTILEAGYRIVASTGRGKIILIPSLQSGKCDIVVKTNGKRVDLQTCWQNRPNALSIKD
jgi:hypothetical protein